MDQKDVMNRWYDALLGASLDKKPVDSPEASFGKLSYDRAYEVQARLIEYKLSHGERVIGWKIGATSRSVMEQLGIPEPIFGCMTTESHYSGLRDVKTDAFCKLAIEGEIALVMDKALKGPGVTQANVIAAAKGVMGAVELVDSRLKDWKMTTGEAIADNALHAGFLLGPVMRSVEGFDLTREGVIMGRNGSLLASACGVEALGDPLNVVVWLANKLSEFGRAIEPGQIILTGSLTRYFHVEPGDVMHVGFSNLGSVQFLVKR